jgi:hypothetical protein
MQYSYRIYPGIGIARIGNSDEYFIGAESPSDIAKENFKQSGKIKKQAARFRIYEFKVDEFGKESIVREVTASDKVEIDWQVQLCNRKAASNNIPSNSSIPRNAGYELDKLIIEAQQTISGIKQTSEKLYDTIQFIRDGHLEGQDTVALGQLKTDKKGRLLVLGGDGVSKSPLGKPLNHFANNSGWYDDCCDGPVNAILTIDGRTVAVEKAWVVVASPAYAPDIKNVTTWYDQAKNVTAQYFKPELHFAPVSFTNDIYPILERVVLLQWVSGIARIGHGKGTRGDFIADNVLNKLASNSSANQSMRFAIVARLTLPNSSTNNPERIAPRPQNMPLLRSGVDPKDPSKFEYPSVTAYQYHLLEKWAEGDFLADWQGIPESVKFSQIPLSEQPHALDGAALESCVGGPFFPGIETTYLMTLADTYEAPYRINQAKPAGCMTELMALPWQADFVACGRLWWPAQRPVSVKREGEFANFSENIDDDDYSGMVKNWTQLGFVIQDDDEYIETERGSISQ